MKSLESSLRRKLIRGLIVSAGLLGSVVASHADISIVDIAGRQVELASPAKRIILSAMTYYPAFSILSRDAPDLIVGVAGPRASAAFETEREISEKPHLGSIWENTFSIEEALALQPDLLVASNPGAGQAPTVEAAFERAGIPVLYVDFFLNPAANTIPSMEIIGRAIGQEEKASEFVAFYRDRVNRISERLEGVDLTRPRILINSRRPGLPCCFALAKGSVAAYFDKLGVTNIAAGRLPGEFGQLNLEYIIESDPEIFVASDLISGPDSLFGEPRSRANGAASLERLLTETGLSELTAMRNRRVHAIDVSLMRSPLNILALENFARWIHPDLFGDLDPQATLDEINERFLSTPLEGPFWISLDQTPARLSGGSP